MNDCTANSRGGKWIFSADIELDDSENLSFLLLPRSRDSTIYVPLVPLLILANYTYFQYLI